MAYKFLETLDFDAAVYKQLLTERTDEAVETILEQREMIAIEIIKSKLVGRYNITAIFAAQGLERHYLIVHYTTTITTYLFFKRNAARKLPSDLKEDYDNIMKDLDKIQAGKMVLDNLPLKIDGEGNAVAPATWANRKNTDFYI